MSPDSPAAKVEWDPDFLLTAPGEFVAEPGSGTTFIEGTVVDEEGKPVPGAALEMHAIPREGMAFKPPSLHASAVAGPDGAFRIGPGPTPWWIQGILSARAPGFARTGLLSRSLTQQGKPAADEGAPARLVLRRGIPVKGEVRAKDGRPLDGPATLWAVGEDGSFEILQADAAGAFELLAPPGAMTVTALDGDHPGARCSITVEAGRENRVTVEVGRGRDVRGRVVDGTTGRPVGGAVLRSYYGSTRIFRAGPDGEFVLPHHWFSGFQVRAPGHAVVTHRLAEDAGSPGVPPETVRLPPGFVARGRVLDLDGRPLPGARLRILTRDPAGDWGSSAGPFSAKDGSFVFVGLPLPSPGQEVPLLATAPECGWGITAPLPGAAGAVLDGIELRVPRMVDMSGRVEDGAGEPLAAALEVQWDVPKGLAGFGDLFPSVANGIAGPDGRWKVRLPERTPFRMVARADQFGDTRIEGRAPSSSEKAPAAVILKVDRGLSIRGTVVDAMGMPVGRGEVRVEPRPPTDPRPSRDVRVREDGTFEAGGLPAGAYDFSVLVHPDFLQEVVRDAAAGAPSVKVVLRRPGGLRFHVVLPPEVPEGTVPDVTLRALEDTRPLASDFDLKLDPYELRASIGPLAPAAYALVVSAGEYRIDFPRVVVTEGDATDLGDLALKVGGAIAGKVALAEIPLPGVSVEAILRTPDGGARTVRRATTGKDGTYRLAGLGSGTYLLAVRCPDRPFVEAAVVVAVGATTTRDVALAAGGRVRVIVKDAAGEPVEGAMILITKDGAGVPFWAARTSSATAQRTGPDGTLRCTGVPPGPITIKAEKPGTGSAEATATVVDGGEGDVEIRIGK